MNWDTEKLRRVHSGKGQNFKQYQIVQNEMKLLKSKSMKTVIKKMKIMLFLFIHSGIKYSTNVDLK